MRLTVLTQTAKGLPERADEEEDQYKLRPGVLKDLERIKWYLWHGNVFQALNELQNLEMHLDRNGEKIASGFVESAINQVVSKRMVKKRRWAGVRVGRIFYCRNPLYRGAFHSAFWTCSMGPAHWMVSSRGSSTGN